MFCAPEAVRAIALLDPQASSAELAYDAPISVFATEEEAPLNGGRFLKLLVAHASPSCTHSIVKRTVLLADGASLEHALRTDHADIQRCTGIACDTVGKRIRGAEVEEVTDAPFYTDGLSFFRLVLNTILYLSSDSPELTDVPRPRVDARTMNHAQRRAIAQQSCLDYASVGDSISPIYVSRQRSALEGPATPSEALYRLTYRLLVRGHWKQQAHGPRRASRKLIWVEPYLRGPDVAEVLNKPYVVV